MVAPLCEACGAVQGVYPCVFEAGLLFLTLGALSSHLLRPADFSLEDKFYNFTLSPSP